MTTLQTHNKKEIIVILDNIRSAHNVGSIFRTSEARGVQEILLCGHTPTPIDRFGRARKDIAKVALGAEQLVPWRFFETTEEAVAEMQKGGASVIAIEQHPRAIEYGKVFASLTSNVIACVFGNEIDGVSQSVYKHADAIAEIPMAGKKESLNVSVSVGIILFGISE